VVLHLVHEAFRPLGQVRRKGFRMMDRLSYCVGLEVYSRRKGCRSQEKIGSGETLCAYLVFGPRQGKTKGVFAMFYSEEPILISDPFVLSPL